MNFKYAGMGIICVYASEKLSISDGFIVPVAFYEAFALSCSVDFMNNKKSDK